MSSVSRIPSLNEEFSRPEVTPSVISTLLSKAGEE